MEENYLFSLFVFFLFSLVFFKKDNKISLNSHNKEESKYNAANSETSGVARYLRNKQDKNLQNQVTGVAKYLMEKEDLDIQSTESIKVSGVEKYLADKEEANASGVSKYMARQAAVLAKK